MARAIEDFFGEDRLADALDMRPDTVATPSGLVEPVTAAVAAFAGDSTHDDQAALVLMAT